MLSLASQSNAFLKNKEMAQFDGSVIRCLDGGKKVLQLRQFVVNIHRNTSKLVRWFLRIDKVSFSSTHLICV